MREIKFRAFLQNHQRTKMFISEAFGIDSGLWKIFKPESYIGIEEVTTSKKFLLEIPESEQEDGWSLIELVQYTGLKDKNGVEIYEFMEIDKVWEVQYLNGSYVLINISNDDIITLYKYMEQKDGQITVTKEYTKI